MQGTRVGDGAGARDGQAAVFCGVAPKALALIMAGSSVCKCCSDHSSTSSSCEGRGRAAARVQEAAFTPGTLGMQWTLAARSHVCP
jgi:hypothetical protein